MILRFITRHKRYLALLGADIIFFGFFTPDQSSWLLLPAFGLLIASLYATFKLLLWIINQFLPVAEPFRRKVLVFATFVTGVVLALQSLGQLTPKDVITVIPLIAILYLYVSYFTLKRQ